MSEVVAHGSRRWVPGNRWDLVADEVRASSSSSPPSAHDATSVAVIVAYFEQPASLQRCYAAVAGSALDPQRHELIVVDDGSSSPPPRPPTNFPLPVHVVRQADLGCRPGAARNLGAATTDADVLVFLDADTLPGPGCIARLAAWPGIVPDVLVVGRRRHVDLSGWSPAETVAWLNGDRAPPPARPDPMWLADGYRQTGDLLDADDRSFRYVISAVMACHRSLFDDVGGFDADRAEYGGEDWDLAYRAFNNGALLVHEPEAVAWHDEPDWGWRDGRLEQKNTETLWLSSAIPEPSSRGAGLIRRYSDVLVVLDPKDACTDGQLVATLLSLLDALGDVAVHVPPDLSADVRAAVRADPRVRPRPPDRNELLRARTLVTLTTAATWDRHGLGDVIDEVRPGRCGVITLHDGHRLVACVESTRARGRRRRASAFGVTAEALAALFTTKARVAEDVGLRPLRDDVDLAALFGRW
ncbi:MAG: glycosyltransferase family 2 protein [Ilumatobacteraceae bacterium]